jgi:catechol 2,3-dioxygenase-like lactoylglutathione lyase family enzyme
MAIFGAHMLLYSSEPEALRAMLRDVFGFPFVDAHGGWLIFALPPAELGVHPQGSANGATAPVLRESSTGPNFESGMRHEISFMCDDIHATIAGLRAKGVQIDGEPETQSYGVTALMSLPGGVQVTLYQPRHKMAIKLPE